ncbi:MAG: hypothetical protein OXC31_27780 [Spirochaetaceae bacterium]|nr:hypothetical protein [Spirochaetaceae bacterium]
MTIILSIAIMFAVVAALSIKVLLGREREVKRFGCGSFNPAGPAAPGAAATACGVCGAEEGEACRNDEDSLASPSGERDDFSRN